MATRRCMWFTSAITCKPRPSLVVPRPFELRRRNNLVHIVRMRQGTSWKTGGFGYHRIFVHLPPYHVTVYTWVPLERSLWKCSSKVPANWKVSDSLMFLTNVMWPQFSNLIGPTWFAAWGQGSVTLLTGVEPRLPVSTVGGLSFFYWASSEALFGWRKNVN